jgi:hypothetical protein
MLKRILAVSVLGLAVGLAACDNKGQEQAQQPGSQGRQQAAPTPTPQQGTTTPPSQQPGGTGSSSGQSGGSP